MKGFFLLLLLLLPSCSLFEKEKETASEAEEEKKNTGPERRIVGRIASVSQAGEFVLIQKFGTGSLPKNTIYQSQGPEGRSASLRPSGERVRDFFAADLISGKVEKGDAVVAYPNPREKEEIPTEEPKSEKIPPKTDTEDEIESKAPSNGQDP